METDAIKILNDAGDAILTTAVLGSFKEVERNYFLRQWKTSELDAGHFVEAIRRLIDLRLTGKYIPIGKTLANFNDSELKRLVGLPGDDSYRLHIPRALLLAYGLRNKRGVGHVGLVSPNYTDATVIIAICRWTLAEILRIESTLSLDQTTQIVERIVERPSEGVWEAGGIRRVLRQGLSVQDQVLFLLFIESPQTDSALKESIEAKDASYFRKVLRSLHAKRQIEYKSDGTCELSPSGYTAAEKITLDAASQ